MRGHFLVVVFVCLSCWASVVSAAGFSDGAIRVALVTDFSGVLSQDAGQGNEVAAEMAIEDAGGAVRGSPVRLYSVDHRLDPDYAVSEVKRLQAEENIDAVVGLVGSNVALAVQKYATEHDIAVLQTTSASDRLTGDR